MTIGEVAEQSNVDVQTIRYYERIGLIRKAPRTSSGYRNFSETTAQRILFIRHAQAAGFTLREISDLIELDVSAETVNESVRERVETKVSEITKRLDELSQVREHLESLLDDCVNQDSDSCPIMDAFNGKSGTTILNQQFDPQ